MSKEQTKAVLLREVATLRRRAAELEILAGSAIALPATQHALRERVKELECVYTISELRETHFSSAERFLQGVVECLPRSWQYPEHASARIVLGKQQHVSANFREGPWRMAAEVRIGTTPGGVVEVFYTRGVPTMNGDPFLREEHALLRVVAERVGITVLQIQTQTELRDAHRILQSQNQAMHETNVALRTVLAHLEDEKQEIRTSMLANIQKIIMPIVFELELAVTGRERSYVTLLRQSLQEISSPFLTQLARSHMELTPVEIAISTMIRNGLSTKDIAQLRCISPGTVRRHRENIRKKLGLQNRKTNLVTFLQASAAEQAEATAAPAHPAAITDAAARR
jgi:DNA-binding NarL/FixJ family response regulator